MSEMSSNWEFLPDDRKLVEVSRLSVPDGWLVHAAGVGGRPRFGSLIHYSDPAHDWRPSQEKGVIGPRVFLQWEQVRMPAPDGFTARLKVPGGWLVYVDLEMENSAGQLVFCPDREHKWQA